MNVTTRDENDIRARLGLLPKGATLPTQIRLYGWIVTAIAGLVATLTRLPRLNHPHVMVFDETYYVKGAYSLLNFGYERNWEGDNQNDLFVMGDLSALEDKPDRWVHPPFGKWLMGIGMRIFGDDNGFGWRATTAILGVVAVMLLVRVALHLFHSVTLAAIAGLAMALDGMGITMARTGLLDNMLMFFVLAAFWAILRDRAFTHTRLAERVAQSGAPMSAAAVPLRPMRWGPRVLGRPWLVLAGVFLGLACGVKWSGAYAIAVFGLMVFFWGAAARKAIGARLWFGAGVWREGIPAFFQLVPTAIAVYVASWFSWFAHPIGWDRQWAAQHPSELPLPWAPDVVNSFIHWHQASMEFHRGLSSPHTYQSQPWAWIIQFRPVSFFWRAGEDVTVDSCPSDDCVLAITSVGNPFVWWIGALALVVVLWAAIRRRDWRAWAILAGYLAMYAPWFLYLNRTIYQFYAISFLPFVALALAFGVGWATRILGPARFIRPPSNNLIGPFPSGPHELLPTLVDSRPTSRAAWWIIGFVVGLILIAALFWMPLWWATPVPRWFWKLHMWMPSWV
ncbi:dolichyl-phosphate-mannose--protein mannosyltransferase [Trueperella pyogenes]